MRTINKRINSVKNTKKIMKAMKLVATSKLQKARSRLENVRTLSVSITEVMDSVRACIDDYDEIAFCEEREVKSIAYVVLTSDRGLCGSFNANVSKEALALIESNKDKQEKIISVGKKGWEYLSRRGKEIVSRAPAASEVSTYAEAEVLGARIADMFLSGEVDEVYVLTTRFQTILSHEPKVIKLLPFKPEDGVESGGGGSHYMSFDPDPKTFIQHAIPMYLKISIFAAMLESAVCEQASRMTSMDSATRNATEIIEKLTLEFNRVRQSKITQELIEIVTGANAVK